MPKRPSRTRNGTRSYPGRRTQTKPSEICNGLKVVAGDFADDPFDNLLAYSQANFTAAVNTAFNARIEELRCRVAEQEPIDFQFTHLLACVEKKHLPAVKALCEDIRVLLLKRRNAILCKVRDHSLSASDIRQLYAFCFGSRPGLDRDLPKIAAQVLIHHAEQTQPAARIASELESIYEAGEQNQDALKRLNRVVSFLGWADKPWAEECLLKILDRFTPKSRVDAIRVHIQVLRSLFSHPSIAWDTVESILESIHERFGPTIPSDLRHILRSVLIACGDDSFANLIRLLESNPDFYFNDFFLGILSTVNKAEMAVFLKHHSEAALNHLTPAAYIAILADSGERDPVSSGEITRFWHGADVKLKKSILAAVRDLHSSEAAPFLIDRIREEQDLALQVEIVDTVACVAGFDEMMHLTRKIERDHSLLHYYTIDLTYRRLLEDPVHLTELPDFLPLYHIQVARSRVYRIYRFLNLYRELLLAIRAIQETCEAMRIDGTLAFRRGSFVFSDGRDIATRLGEIDSAARHLALVGRLDFAFEQYNEGRHMVKELTGVLEQAPFFSPHCDDNVMGRTTPKYHPGELLSREDFLHGPPARRKLGKECISDLIEKAEKSIRFFQEVLLFKEWFIRQVPFVLHEGMPEMLLKIERCEEIAFSPQGFSDKQRRNYFRKAFRVFYECTKQGVYLTDVLLEYVNRFPREKLPVLIEQQLTHRRSEIARGTYAPSDWHKIPFLKHLQFTTFAHDYRYGKESLARVSIVYLWLQFMATCAGIKKSTDNGNWPILKKHPSVPETVGPLIERLYAQHAEEAEAVRKLILQVFRFWHEKNVRVRVIPNLTYGLFALAPAIDRLMKAGIHISFAGISSRYCDDENVNQFYVSEDAVFPIKPYLFSTASDYGTLNRDRILIVVDGTMEPLDRHNLDMIRLPKSHRGYINHLVAVNYVRSRDGYVDKDPTERVASAMQLPVRYVRNLIRTTKFRRLLESLRLSFDKEELFRGQEQSGSGQTLYSFFQWNPDGMEARTGSIGFKKQTVACADISKLTCPSMLFVSMNSLFSRENIAAFFDNNPEVERPRLIVGPKGVKIDVGWPHKEKGIEIKLEGRNHWLDRL